MFPIARAFANQQQASDAVAALLEEGFPNSAVTLLAPPSSDASDATPASLRDAMDAGFSLYKMNSKEVNALNEAARTGSTLVAVEARYGESNAAAQILAQHDPIQFTELETEREPFWDPAAPFSSATMLPVLLRGRSSTNLVHGRSITKLINGLTFGNGQLTKPGFSLFGDGLKRNSPAPLSSMIGWKPVSEHKEWKTSFGLPLLTSK